MKKSSQPSVLTFRCGTVEVGDIFRAYWGYEQTNVNFYQVVSLHGKKTVIVKEIAAETTYTNSMQGTKKPIPNEFVNDDPIKRRIHDDSSEPTINIESFIFARKTTKDLVHNFTAYA